MNEDEKTRPIRRNKPAAEATVDLSSTSPSPAAATDNATRVVRTAGNKPTTGWLVVIDGPGKGNSLPLYHGTNNIGRAATQEINLDFGAQTDSEIARENQARLSYDPKGNAFYLQHGDGKNLTYLNDAPVLELKVLKPYDRIGMGKTTLAFVPFCCDQFTWDDE